MTGTGLRPSTLPNVTANPAPLRRAGAVRRTSSIDVEWPDGSDGLRILHGRARDSLTLAGGGARILAEERMEATVATDRTITALSATPAPEQLPRLVGQRGGGRLRQAMAEMIPELITSAAPLYLLLDDISGVSLISNWAWLLWRPEWLERLLKAKTGEQFENFVASRRDVCWGFQEGHSSLDPNATSLPMGTADGGELRNPADAAGWHAFPAIEGISMRRARRIDVWRDAASGLIHIDSAFQDSAPRPDGTRSALHEYCLSATLDPDTLALLSLTPEPRVLPYPECPGAVANTQKLLGTPLADIRTSVLDALRGPAGCTHLNDALRALGDVPALVRQLPG